MSKEHDREVAQHYAIIQLRLDEVVAKLGALILVHEMILHQDHMIAHRHNPDCPVCLREGKEPRDG